MNNPLVSIIIPVYNSGKYLSETIHSALQQTWKNKEIIIIDDGSVDNSLTIAKTFERDILHVFHQENKGASAARNYGLSKAKGDYIQFLDSDDILPPQKIEKQIPLLLDQPDCIVGCRWIRFKNSIDNTFGAIGPDISIRLNMPPLKWLQIRHTMLPHAWLTPRNLIEKAGNWDEAISCNDDGEFFFRVVARAKSVLYADDVTVYYRSENNGSLSTLNTAAKNLSSYLVAESYKNVLYQLSPISHESQLAIGNYFKELMYMFYPEYPELVKKCMLQPEITVSNLAFNGGGMSTKILTKLIGWKLAKHLQRLFHNHNKD